MESPQATAVRWVDGVGARGGSQFSVGFYASLLLKYMLPLALIDVFRLLDVDQKLYLVRGSNALREKWMGAVGENVFEGKC